MKEKNCDKEGECCMGKYRNHCHSYSNAGGGGAVYGLGLIGAAIFFIGKATTFWMGVLGFLKALVWPAFLVYEAFKFLIG